MATMYDVALKAGVSQTTVSFVFNGKGAGQNIPEATRLRVLETAREIGYRRNELARAAITGKNRVLGFLVHKPENEAAARILGGALDEAEEAGHFIKVLRLRDQEKLDRETIERCFELRLAGVMVLYLSNPMLEILHGALAKEQIPVAIADSSQPQNWGLRVDTDNVQSMTLAVEHLKSLGHQKIALLTSRAYRMSGKLESAFGVSREAGFRAAMTACDLPVREEFVIDCRSERPRMETAARALLSGSNRPTAIIGVTDSEAMVAMSEAIKKGLQVPEDVSFLGYGGLPMGQFAPTPLSAVRQPFENIGRVAVRRLLERIQSKQDGHWSDEPLQELLPSTFTRRESTAPARI